MSLHLKRQCPSKAHKNSLFSINFDSKTGRQQRILVDFSGRWRGCLSLKWTLVDGEKRGVPKGGLDMCCPLVFVLVHCVLETCMFCSLRVLFYR
jgi:hypothetical protein